MCPYLCDLVLLNTEKGLNSSEFGCKHQFTIPGVAYFAKNAFNALIFSSYYKNMAEYIALQCNYFYFENRF